MSTTPYDIGTPGTPWGASERAAWRARQDKKRDFEDDVGAPIRALAERFAVVQYGVLGPEGGSLPLLGLRTRDWQPDRPVALITGGVHGYETSGVHGALRFAQAHAAAHEGRWNLVLAPCVSPWGYETVNRWNPAAEDPNRSFRPDSPAPEARQLQACIADQGLAPRLHLDLHETTDTDHTEFRPALAARDGKPFTPGSIPDGFYLVDDADDPQPAFHAAMIEAVEQVTHIAPADDQGQIIGSDVVQPGVIRYAFKPLGLCAGLTDARLTTTTEVYPDSPRATPELCNAAQVAAVRSGLDYLLG